MSILVTVLRAASLLAFAGPALLIVGGRGRNAAGALTGVAATEPRSSQTSQPSGCSSSFLAAFAGNAEGPAALVLALCGCLLALAGAALVLWSRAELGSAWSLVPTADQGTGLVTTGPYRFVRHPIYLGLSCWRWARPSPSAAGPPPRLYFPRLCRPLCGARARRKDCWLTRLASAMPITESKPG